VDISSRSSLSFYRWNELVLGREHPTYHAAPYPSFTGKINPNKNIYRTRRHVDEDTYLLSLQ
jgi:hypothetical protein